LTTELAREFEQIKKTFFPKWDPAGEWRVKYRALERQAGRHNPRTRIITIAADIDGTALREAIIHEIGHVLEGNDHTVRWQSRLLEAASTAEFLGQDSLAGEIRDDVTHHRLSQIIPDAAVALLDPACDIDFKEFVRWAARHYGMDADDLAGKYPDIERSFNSARAGAGEFVAVMQRVRSERGRKVR
jgi:hypothetical protein